MKEKEQQSFTDKMEIDASVHQPTTDAATDLASTEKTDGKDESLKGKDVQRESESSAHGAARTGGKNKPYCYRCLTKAGHVHTECTTQISCDLCVLIRMSLRPARKLKRQSNQLCCVDTL